MSLSWQQKQLISFAFACVEHPWHKRAQRCAGCVCAADVDGRFAGLLSLFTRYWRLGAEGLPAPSGEKGRLWVQHSISCSKVRATLKLIKYSGCTHQSSDWLLTEQHKRPDERHWKLAFPACLLAHMPAPLYLSYWKDLDREADAYSKTTWPCIAGDELNLSREKKELAHFFRPYWRIHQQCIGMFNTSRCTHPKYTLELITSITVSNPTSVLRHDSSIIFLLAIKSNELHIVEVFQPIHKLTRCGYAVWSRIAFQFGAAKMTDREDMPSHFCGAELASPNPKLGKLIAQMLTISFIQHAMCHHAQITETSQNRFPKLPGPCLALSKKTFQFSKEFILYHARKLRATVILLYMSIEHEATFWYYSFCCAYVT